MTNPIMSLAAFKTALAIRSRWLVRRSYKGSGEPEPTITEWAPREVVLVQTNAVGFADSFDPLILDAARKRPHANARWFYFPKASQCTFPAPGTIRIAITEDPEHWLEYRPMDEKRLEAVA